MTDRIHRYAWTAGFHCGTDPDVIGPEIERLAGAPEGSVTARQYVNVAESEDSPLHDTLEWDDSVAADRWRIRQAQQIIRSLRVVAKEGDPPQPAMLSMKIADPEEPNARAYFTMTSVFNDPQKRREFLLDEVDSILRRLDRTLMCAEMEPFRKAAEEVLDTLAKQRKQLVQAAD